MTIRRHASTAGWLALVATSTFGCTTRLAGPNDELGDARQRWEQADVHDYSYELFLECECLVYGGIAITVEDDEITAAEWIAPPEGAPEVPPARTIDELFAEIDAGLDRRPDDVLTEYDPELGYPIRVLLDYEDAMADEEFSFRIENFSAHSAP